MSAPKKYIDKRIANALIPKAQAKGMMGGLTSAVAKQTMGGLWVGGNAWLTAEELSFEPNALNRHYHLNPEDLTASVRLVDVTDVTWRKGLVTSIIDIETADEKLSIRCYKSKAFADAIRRAVEAAKAAEARP
ncbi:MAG: hypothetical protein RIB03_06220 [Henriciella sp.]|uniref:hypothetical protein n=1 Tax=Henriciella sp. TaxID=1968823 RepID=UPI0032EF3C91